MRRAPQQVHLPEAIACGHVALCEIEIGFVRSFNVRDAALIAPDSHWRMKSGELNRHLTRGSGGRLRRHGGLFRHRAQNGQRAAWKNDSENRDNYLEPSFHVVTSYVRSRCFNERSLDLLIGEKVVVDGNLEPMKVASLLLLFVLRNASPIPLRHIPDCSVDLRRRLPKT